MEGLQTPDYAESIATELNISPLQVKTTLQLLGDGNTIPFIARYRKEMTGELDENQLRDIAERYDSKLALSRRKEEVVHLVEDQGLLQDAAFSATFLAAINAATSLTEVDDLYRPYRPKRKTRASVAKERGLEPLFQWLLHPHRYLLEETQVLAHAAAFVDEDLGIASAEEALQGAADIFAEMVADDAESRKWIRETTKRQGKVASTCVDESVDSVYTMYYQYEEPISRIVPHRVLAMNRGEREGYLKIAVHAPDDRIVDHLVLQHVSRLGTKRDARTNPSSFVRSILARAVQDGYKRLMAPAISREIRSDLTATAEAHAIEIFGENLRNLLLQPPLRGKVALGVDPAYRTGCKLAVVDETGKLLHTHVIYPTPPQNKVEQAQKDVAHLLDKFGVGLVVIGNGTASRETEAFIADCLRRHSEQTGGTIPYAIASEAGASVYSASKLAGQEFPQLDVAERSAISIARRMQDPLAELVKIDPKSIGVGQYQHDVSQRDLDEKLGAVVETAVNQVGVDVNTASPSLLSYVAGLNKTVARNIVATREEHGAFLSRQQLSKVPRLGPKTLEQCVGFLRITGGNQPLDATPIHPESYAVVERLLDLVGGAAGFFTDLKEQPEKMQTLENKGIAEIAEQLSIGEPTLKDILDALKRPGRDPRDDVPPPILRTDVLKLEDLKIGMVLSGTVRNVVDFGAFVDIGVKHDGLVHISELANRFVKHPMDVVAVGDTVEVRVMQIDIDKGRVGLSMRDIHS